MADQHSSSELAPSLQAVLSSLNVNLEEELNRYRRNRVFENISAANDSSNDVFESIDDSAFDLAPAAGAFAGFGATLAISPASGKPPPLPPNKKLLAANKEDSADAGDSAYSFSSGTATHTSGTSNSSQNNHPFNTAVPPLTTAPTAQAALTAIYGESASANHTTPEVASLNFASPNPSEVPLSTPITGLIGNELSAGVDAIGPSSLSLSTSPEASSPYASNDPSNDGLNGGYLTSSEKLIESLNEVHKMPEPVDTTFKPQRKTVSLLAGATLGLLGLVAGLGASYLMSNPIVAQRLATGFGSGDSTVTAANPQTFDPPGPDLSAQEFVDIDIDNLSSLNMPQTAIDPLSSPAGPASPTPLPPIANPSQTAQGSGSSPGNQPGLTPSIETQAVVVPTGSNFYVTVPFTTEQALADVRQAVDEAFVRQFSDGNRVQLAVFDNAETAQQFVAELQAKGVSAAQVYGPTAE